MPSASEIATTLRDATGGVRIRGAGTRPWGHPVETGTEISTSGLDAIVEHNVGDLTAVVQAGVRLSRLREAFAAEGQMLAVDAPGDGTIGGLVATADSGPLRHRYHAVRDLVLGVEVALADGTVARAGSKVIKNVAGYDLAKLFTGSYGTLGVVTEISLRLHPLARETATAVARFEDARSLAQAAAALAARPLEADALDLYWADGRGELLARFAGGIAAERAADAGLDEVVGDDDALWERQRAGQRSHDGVVVRVSTTVSGLADALEAAPRAVGRAGLGLLWVTVPDADGVRALRERLAPAPCVVLDGLPEGVDPWGDLRPAELALMRSVKARFDPANTCNPGRFVV